MSDETFLRERMVKAYRLGVKAYKNNKHNMFDDKELAKLVADLNCSNIKFLTQEWENGYNEQRLNS